jgi:hypothetical protein
MRFNKKSLSPNRHQKSVKENLQISLGKLKTSYIFAKDINCAVTFARLNPHFQPFLIRFNNGSTATEQN